MTQPPHQHLTWLDLTQPGLDAYQQAVERTSPFPNTLSHEAERLKLALVGMQDELGEIAGPLKKYLWHGHGFDVAHIEDELGDLVWYVALLCNTLDIALAETLQRNVKKLHERYPDGFSEQRSQQREEAAHDHQ